MKTRYTFWIKWLKITSIIVVVFGLFMAVSSIIPKESPSPIDNQINPAFFNENEITVSVQNFQAWQYGVGASMLVSWGILMFF